MSRLSLLALCLALTSARAADPPDPVVEERPLSAWVDLVGSGDVIVQSVN